MNRTIFARYFDIESRIEGQRSRFGCVTSHFMISIKKTYPDVVCHDYSIEAPLLAQDLGQQKVRRVTRFTINIMISRHNGSGVGLLDRHLEWEQTDIGYLH